MTNQLLVFITKPITKKPFIAYSSTFEGCCYLYSNWTVVLKDRMIIQEQIEIKPQKQARVVRLGHYNPSEVLIALQCRFCDILLTGRDQFLGHMFHNHELEYEKLLDSWNQIVSVMGKMNHQAQTQSDTGEKPSLMRSAP